MFLIAHPEFGAVAVTEVEFSQIASQVPLAVLLGGTDHAALETEKSPRPRRHGVRRAHILWLVVNGLMRWPLGEDKAVKA